MFNLIDKQEKEKEKEKKGKKDKSEYIDAAKQQQKRNPVMDILGIKPAIGAVRCPCLCTYTCL